MHLVIFVLDIPPSNQLDKPSMTEVEDDTEDEEDLLWIEDIQTGRR